MEKIMIMNLKAMLRKPTTKRHRVAVSTLRYLVARHAKVDISEVKLDSELVQQLFVHGGEKPLHKIKVKIFTDEKGIVTALPPEKKVEKATTKKEVKEKKPSTAKTGEAKASEKKEAEEKEKPKPKFEQRSMDDQQKPKFEQKSMEGMK